MIQNNYIFGRKYKPTYIDSILAYYKFDSNSNDFVNSFNGTNFNMTYVSGQVGNCADFNGTNGYVSIPYNSQFSPTNGSNDIPYSWAFILKRNGDTVTSQTILGRRDTTVGQEYWIGFSNIGQMDFSIFSQGGSNFIGKRTPVSTFVNGSTYRVFITYDGSGNNNGIKIYVNGILTGSSNIQSGTYVRCNSQNISTFLGQLNLSGSPTRYLKGTLDEFVFFREKELSQAEINQIDNLWLNNNPIL
jgi:hypothetical protein